MLDDRLYRPGEVSDARIPPQDRELSRASFGVLALIALAAAVNGTRPATLAANRSAVVSRSLVV
jgi:hypothetical protein